MITLCSFLTILKKYRNNKKRYYLFFFLMMIFQAFLYITIDLSINFPSELFHPVVIYIFALIFNCFYFYIEGIKIKNKKIKYFMLGMILILYILFFIISNSYLYRKFYISSFLMLLVMFLLHVVAYFLINNQKLAEQNEVYLQHKIDNQKLLYELTKELLESRHHTLHQVRKNIQLVMKAFGENQHSQVEKYLFETYMMCVNRINVFSSGNEIFDIVHNMYIQLLKTKAIVITASFYESCFDLDDQQLKMLFEQIICSILKKYEQANVVINATRAHQQILLDIQIKGNQILSIGDEELYELLTKH